MVRRWLRLHHDTSNAAIHAPIPEGGRGLFSTIATSKKLNESRLLNVEGIGGDEDSGTIIRSPHVLQIMEPKFIKAYIDTSTRDLHKHIVTQDSDVTFSSFDVGSSYHGEAEFAKRWIVHPLTGNVSWV